MNSHFGISRILVAVFCLVLTNALNVYGQKAAAVDPRLSAAVQQARALIARGDMAGAETVLRAATNEFSNAPGPWFLLGNTLYAQKKYAEALKAYDRSKSAPSLAANSFYNIACVHAIQGSKDEAFAALDASVSAGYSNFAQLQSDADFTNIKNDKRFSEYKLQWLGDDQVFVEPTRIIQKWVGETAGDQFGWTARRIDDLDGDGVTDLIATAPTYRSGSGKIYVYSSKSGKLIHSVTGRAGHRLGNSAVGLGDIDGDTIADFIAGAPNANNRGAAYVYSGKDASVIHSLSGSTPAGQFGYEVSEAGDMDGDSVADFVVGEMAGNGNAKASGRVVVYSGKSAKLIFELGGERTGDGFGNAVAVTKTKGNNYLLAIGAQNAGPSNRGRVYVYQVEDAIPTLRFVIEGDQNSTNLGQMFISFPGDLNRDSVPDVYASDFGDNTKVPGGGKVVVHSGADGKQLLTIHGTVPREGLGTSPSDAGDVDGDGIGDLVIGAWQNREGSRAGGKVYLYSAAGNGKLLQTWTCKQAGDTFGFDACGIGDVDGDGAVDFLLTSAWSGKHGPKTGRVFIVAGKHFGSHHSSTSPR